jgi:hypothetical protein
MADKISWQGHDPVVLAPSDEASSLAEVHASLRDHLEQIVDCKPRAVESELRHAADRLVEAYDLAQPIWLICRTPLAHRLNNAAELHEIFARLDAAEIDFVSRLARARRAWLFRALHYPDIEGQ